VGDEEGDINVPFLAVLEELFGVMNALPSMRSTTLPV
jgi:hypothetical protein